MKKVLFSICMFLGIMQMADAQRFGYSNYVTGWNNNVPLGYGTANLYVPNGYVFQDFYRQGSQYFARYQYNRQYYQQPVYWQENRGIRIAQITLNVIGSTLLNISNELQRGNSWNNNFYTPSQPYFYQNSPPVYYQNNYYLRSR